MSPEFSTIINTAAPVILSLIGWSLRKWAAERDAKDVQRDLLMKEIAGLVNTQTIEIAILKEKVARIERERDDA